MKTITFVSTLAIAAVTLISPSLAQQKVGPAGNIIVPGGLAPEVQQMKSNGQTPGSQRVKIRYGPYPIPSINENNIISILRGERGVSQHIAVGLKKPCSNCGVLEMLAGLEYADGTLATVDTKAWLHHTVVMVSGAGRTDLTCPQGPLSIFGERIFASGNERTPIVFTQPGSTTLKTVLPLKQTDQINMQLELMNMDTVAKNTYFTVEYEYLPTIPAGYKQTRSIWLDVTTCGDSNVNPPAGKNQFSVAMQPWTAPFDGSIFFVMGHLHDGGVNVRVYQNNKVVCTSSATYSVGGGGHKRRDGPHNDAMPHISNMSTCKNVLPVKKGDKLYIDAQYDFAKHMGMQGDRGYTPVMGIAELFVALPL